VAEVFPEADLAEVAVEAGDEKKGVQGVEYSRLKGFTISYIV
jgi:hypothetical protein